MGNGFKDAFNLSYRRGPTGAHGWFDSQYIAIDQGPILLMIENYRTGFIWNLMKNNPYLKKGLERAGFSGGWLGTTVAAKSGRADRPKPELPRAKKGLRPGRAAKPPTPRAPTPTQGLDWARGLPFLV